MSTLDSGQQSHGVATALCLTAGSVPVFRNGPEAAAIRFFTVGSLSFIAKPTIWPVRDHHMLAFGDRTDLAQRLSGG